MNNILRAEGSDRGVLWGAQLLTALCYFYTIVRKDHKLSREFVSVMLRDALMEATGGV
jgi:hypothetical protein